MEPERNNLGVSEVLGTLLLIGITISIFSILYVSILSVTPPPSYPSINIVSKIDSKNISIYHCGGKPLELDTLCSVYIDSIRINFTVADYLNAESKTDGLWNVGEVVIYPVGDTTGKQVEITISDQHSKSVVIEGVLQNY